MSKLLQATLVATAFAFSQPVLAGTCAGASCGSKPPQFVPGQLINVEIVNLTGSLVQVEKVKDTDAIALSPGQQVSFVKGGSTERNLSLIFWDVNGLRLRVSITKPEYRTLRVELLPGGQIPGERSVYLKDDGSIAVL